LDDGDGRAVNMALFFDEQHHKIINFVFVNLADQ
jgi:hypothetical protein